MYTKSCRCCFFFLLATLVSIFSNATKLKARYLYSYFLWDNDLNLQTLFCISIVSFLSEPCNRILCSLLTFDLILWHIRLATSITFWSREGDVTLIEFKMLQLERTHINLSFIEIRRASRRISAVRLVNNVGPSRSRLEFWVKIQHSVEVKKYNWDAMTPILTKRFNHRRSEGEETQ